MLGLFKTETDKLRPIVQMRPSRAYYTATFGRLMNDLRIQLVGLGLFVVSLTLLNQLIGNPALLSDPSVWWRMGLFMLAVAFTVYDVIAGEIHLHLRPDAQVEVLGRVRPLFVLGYIFFELTMFAVNVVIVTFPVLSIFAGGSEILALHNIFLLNALWHIVNFLWFTIEPSRLRDYIRHLSYAALSVALYLITSGSLPFILPDWVTGDIGVIALYAAMILSIYFIQVRRFLVDDIAVRHNRGEGIRSLYDSVARDRR